ncbi:MAG: hypothetical protein FWC27_14975 [Firmicutes bacterium]|nr:hypothetical protein [Bacillota bacterium]
MKITGNIAMLELERPNGAIYPTLVWDDKLVLIDTRFPGQTDALVNAIEAEGFRAEERASGHGSSLFHLSNVPQHETKKFPGFL